LGHHLVAGPLPEQGQLAHHQPDDEQQDDRDDVLAFLDAEGEVGLGVEEVEADRGDGRRRDTGQASSEDGRGDDEHDQDQRHVGVADGVAHGHEQSGDEDDHHRRGAAPADALGPITDHVTSLRRHDPRDHHLDDFLTGTERILTRRVHRLRSQRW
jgi:hypothetical protein